MKIWKRMAATLQQRVEKLKHKAALLQERYTAICRAKSEADSRIAELTEEIKTLNRKLSEKETEIERLKVSSVLTPDHRDVEKTRQFISGLVRDIDKCIAQLSV
ncbi:MAG: hypothetical protein K2L29_02295 [Duncaniella sp.]|nr:hypothetical protein [Duncaniella sp.]MDE5919091.1 hypothetical protein [Duncaniella sp.]MDE6328067.1 hypothetical protein [Duncaniella sp.]MDE6358408.1 hypothetical protein [Duncaniella sp.]MDE6465455.1 hypothetical protein [Duncaniella sp.]